MDDARHESSKDMFSLVETILTYYLFQTGKAKVILEVGDQIGDSFSFSMP